MENNQANNIYQALAKALGLAVLIIILLWLLSKIISAILLLIFAIVLAIIINAPVSKLQNKGMKRGWACLIVFGAIVVFLTLLGLLVFPKVSEQFQQLISNLPSYAENLSKRASDWFESIPAIGKKINEEGLNISKWIPSMPETLLRIGNYSMSILGGLIIFIIFVSMVVYAVVNPRPLLEIYFTWFPKGKKEKAASAFQHASKMLVGWFRANLIGGGIEAVLVTAFLSIMNVPGAWVWGALALFAELIPKIGFYIMSIPPILVALSVSTNTALWVTIFFLALNEVMGDFVMPKLRSSTMSIHPVSTLFMMLAMTSAFGFVGALLATPMAAIIKAYYYSFYVGKEEKNHQLDQYIEESINTPPGN